MNYLKRNWLSLVAASLIAISLSIPASASFTGTPVVVDSNIPGKDAYALQYSGTGLGAQTLNDYVDGRTYRTYSLHQRYTAGGTLALKVYVSNEDVASGSVTDWQDKSSELLGSASISATGVESFVALYRWIKFEWVLTGSGNALAYELLYGW